VAGGTGSLELLASTSKKPANVRSVAFALRGTAVVLGTTVGDILLWNWMTSFSPHVELIDTTIARASAVKGAGVYVGDGDCVIRRSVLDDCHADLSGALVVDGGNLTLASTTITSCSAQEYGVVWLRNATFHISDAVFERNMAPATVFTEVGPVTHSDTMAAIASTLIASRFVGNLGPIAVRAHAQLNWTCQPGYWMSSTGVVEQQDFTGCPNPCAEGFVGTSTTATLSTCDSPCPAGNYCPQGTTTPRPCPSGCRHQQLHPLLARLARQR
jgi:hypothetical protein